MCGFVAVIGAGSPLSRNVLEAMRDQLAHRGPDGADSWFGQHERGTIALGFRRLAIIDTRHAADQPMISADGRKVIVFNGAIYNYVELRAQLQAQGRVFRTRSDTEVLLQAYEHWGSMMLERLNGMYAFVIWDASKGQVLLARDRLGEKPLFFCRLPDGKLAVASEIKALLAHPDLPINYDLEMFGRVLGGYLIYGTCETLFKGIQQLSAAHYMEIDAGGTVLNERRYWTPRYDRALGKLEREELIAHFREKLEQSVAMRMRSDVPVTACLSGGLDSSTLVSLLRRQPPPHAGNVITSAISARFPNDPTIDEGYFVDRMLTHTGLTGHGVTPTPQDLGRDIRALHWHQETIVAGPSMYLEWCVMYLARQLGYKVIIDGQGADELLAGYRSYFQTYQVELAQQGLMGLFKAVRLGRRRDQRLRQVASLYSQAERRFGTRDSFSIKQMRSYLAEMATQRRNEYGSDALPMIDQVGALRFDLALNLLCTSLPSNLYSGDRNSMAHGIECRYPFLDYELIDFCTKLPDWAYLNDGWNKALLRQSMTEVLPQDVCWRVDKVGFAAPQDQWLRTPTLQAWLHERIFDARLQAIPGYVQARLHQQLADHLRGSADYSSSLWQWASAAELLAMRAEGAWVNEKKPLYTSISSEFESSAIPQHGKIQKTAWIISWTPIVKEPRVIRQAQTLLDAGWRLVVFGYAGPTPCPDNWHAVLLPQVTASPPRRLSYKIIRLARNLFRVARIWQMMMLLAIKFAPLDKLRQLAAEHYHAGVPQYKLNRQTIEAFQTSYPQEKPDLILCHDYFTAPVGFTLARRHQAAFSIDCHEYARGQFMQDSRWVRWFRPYVQAIQNRYLPRADAVTTVCDGIAELLSQEHQLRRPVTTVRSIPFFTEQPLRPTGEIITVLYHGEIYASRDLHVAVRALRLWRSEFRLLLRGYSDPVYVAELRRLACEHGVEHRLSIEPPVPFSQIIPAANQADVGYFVCQDSSPQRRFTLPNKFFEYVMAGLALCVSDLPEMAHLVEQYQLGVLAPNCDEETIAYAINSLSREKIDTMKQSSLAAARELNWGKEQERLLSLYQEIVS